MITQRYFSMLFFFSSRRRHTRFDCDWSSDVCSSDLPLKMSQAELVERLMMAGLNHESTEQLGHDWAIDLEVTSNRPDCLGHIGIPREAAVLSDLQLKFSDAESTGASKITPPSKAAQTD